MRRASHLCLIIQNRIQVICIHRNLWHLVSCNAHVSCLLFSPLCYAFPLFVGEYFEVSLGGKIQVELLNYFKLGLKFRNWSWLGKKCKNQTSCILSSRQITRWKRTVSGDRSRIDIFWSFLCLLQNLSIPFILKYYGKAPVFEPASLPSVKPNFFFFNLKPWWISDMFLKLPENSPYQVVCPPRVGLVFREEVRITDPVQKKGQNCVGWKWWIPEPVSQRWKYLPWREQVWFLVLSPELVYIFYIEYSLGKMLQCRYQFVILME